MNRFILLKIISLIFATNVSAQNNSLLKLWYNEPAKEWVEALPVGNGRLGAMVFGTPQSEEIQLNEETIWGGGPYRNDNPKSLEALPKARELIFEGKTSEADLLINETFFTSTNGMPYQSAGSVILNFPGHEKYQNYYRELDLNRAVVKIRYTVNDVNYTREVFSSFDDDVIIMQITASKKGSLNFEIEYANQSEHTIFKKGNVLALEGKGSDHEGISGEIRYQTHTMVKNKGGNVEITDDKIFVSNATIATIYISIGTNFINYKNVGDNQAEKAANFLVAAEKKKYKSAIIEHTKIYRKQFNRFKLDLGSVPEASQLTIPQRISSFQSNQDPALVTLLFQFGRYLLISSSQPGGQPANLQGIWCNSISPSWDSKYTININTEMNYWPAEVTNLSENHEPLFQMLKELSESGQKTAKNMYGAEGWVAHHNTDLWRVTSPIDYAAAGMWPSGGTWLSQHLWEHFLFTGDKKFLTEIYPIMKGAADFSLTSLVEHPDYGWMVVSPSVSPEHGPMCAGCTMDNQLVFDILTKTAQANKILGKDETYRARLMVMAGKLPPMQIGKYSQLQEWIEDQDDPRDTHRHVSHLYGLYPGNQISPHTCPELFEAARNSLNYRGDLATGWSIGWKINLWARLLDGNHAYKIINNMLSLAEKNNPEGRTYPNMFTAHPPFQIDGNFGLTAGVAEMLVQSHDGAIHLLPSLPDNWKDGSVSGIMARGAFEISMKWKNGEVSEASVLSKIGGNLRLRSYVPLKGKGLNEAKATNPNIFYTIPQIKDPLKHNKKQMPLLGLRKVYEYDISTQKGDIIEIRKQ